MTQRDNPTASKRFWLWRNHNDQFGDHWLAFDSEFPTIGDGDPVTIGEPEYVAVERGRPMKPCTCHRVHPQQCPSMIGPGPGTYCAAEGSPASDLRERAWRVIGQTCSYTGTTEGAKLVERIVAEFIAIRAEAKAEGWEDAVKAQQAEKHGWE